MSMSNHPTRGAMNFLIIVSISLNVIGTTILAIPIFRLKEWLEDEEIVKWGKNLEYEERDGNEIEKEKCWAIRAGQIKFRKVAFIGLFLIVVGILLQIFDAFL